MSEELHFEAPLPLIPFNYKHNDIECNFPGCDVYRDTFKYLLLKEEVKKIKNHERIRGWMTPYHVKRK